MNDRSRRHVDLVRRRSLIVRVWAACLLVAAANHLRILWRHGLFCDYGGAHWASAAYWSGLTLLDPVVAALLFVRPKPGIAAVIALMVTNVGHNLTVSVWFASKGGFSLGVLHPFLISQIVFLLFVLATARLAWRGAAPARRDGGGRVVRA